MKWFVIAWLALASISFAQEPIKPVPTTSDAMGWAIAHQLSIPESQRGGYRYLWIPPWMTFESINGEKYDERHVAAAISYAINESASQTGLVIKPEVIANGWMVAVYLPNYASTTKKSLPRNTISQLQMLTDTWDSIATDEPYFHVTDENSGVRVPVVAPHIKTELASLLNQLNASPALVYRADHFLERMLGDRYYEFKQIGIPDGTTVVRFDGDKKMLVDRRNVLEIVGASEELARKIDGDQRIALFTSNVTGKPRIVERIQGASGRFGTGAVWMTHDMADESVDVTKHPLYNLLTIESDGGELIAETSNGLHIYALYDSKGNLVTEAPANLVSDHTIPPPPDGPGTRRLIPAISCIRCHGAGEGLQTAGNDVQKLLANGTDIIDDLSNTIGTSTDNVNRIAGLYAGDFGRRIGLGRDDYTAAVRRATAMPAIPEGMGVAETATVISQLFRDYSYDRVTAEQACWELGFEPGIDAKQTLRRVLAPENTGGIAFQNVVIAALFAGQPVRRKDWEQVYGAARLHVVRLQLGLKDE